MTDIERQAYDKGREFGLSQACTHLRGEARRLQTSEPQRLTTAERHRLISYLQRLARTVESLR